MASVLATVSMQSTPVNDIGPFYSAPDDVTIRLLIRNTGASVVLLAYESSVLNGDVAAQGDSKRFPLDPGDDVVFVLEPRQGICGIAIGAAGQVSFHASRALPIMGVS